MTLFHLEPSPRALHIADYLVDIDDDNRRIVVRFDPAKIGEKFSDWKSLLTNRGHSSHLENPCGKPQML